MENIDERKQAHTEVLADTDDSVHESVVTKMRECLQWDQKRMARRTVGRIREGTFDVAEEIRRYATGQGEQCQDAEETSEKHFCKSTCRVRLAYVMRLVALYASILVTSR